jgi:hypothetical protein
VPVQAISSEVVTVNRAPVEQRGEHGGVLGGEPDRPQCFVQARIDEHEMPSTAVLRDDHDMSAQIGRPVGVSSR